jgi:hypothetical protein
MFNEIQRSEIRCLAKEIVASENWNDLPWNDAWNGAYPIRPSNEEIEHEARELEIKAGRIISEGSLIHEYGDVKEHIRMISLESAKSFNIYA